MPHMFFLLYRNKNDIPVQRILFPDELSGESTSAIEIALSLSKYKEKLKPEQYSVFSYELNNEVNYLATVHTEQPVEDAVIKVATWKDLDRISKDPIEVKKFYQRLYLAVWPIIPKPPVDEKAINNKRFLLGYINGENLRCIRMVESKGMSLEMSELEIPNMFELERFNDLVPGGIIISRVRPALARTVPLMLSDIHEEYHVGLVSDLSERPGFVLHEYLDKIMYDIDAMIRFTILLDKLCVQ